jgi:hypothetical protein
MDAPTQESTQAARSAARRSLMPAADGADGQTQADGEVKLTEHEHVHAERGPGPGLTGAGRRAQPAPTRIRTSRAGSASMRKVAARRKNW